MSRPHGNAHADLAPRPIVEAVPPGARTMDRCSSVAVIAGAGRNGSRNEIGGWCRSPRGVIAQDPVGFRHQSRRTAPCSRGQRPAASSGSAPGPHRGNTAPPYVAWDCRSSRAGRLRPVSRGDRVTGRSSGAESSRQQPAVHCPVCKRRAARAWSRRLPSQRERPAEKPEGLAAVVFSLAGLLLRVMTVDFCGAGSRTA